MELPDSLRNLSFPCRLHSMLEQAETKGYSSIVSWLESGKGFKIYDRKVFELVVLPQYFSPIKYKSFQRQLYFYGFERISSGKFDAGGYTHPAFIPNHPEFCDKVVRVKKNATKPRSIQAAKVLVSNDNERVSSVVNPNSSSTPLDFLASHSCQEELKMIPRISSTIIDDIIDIFGSGRKDLSIASQSTFYENHESETCEYLGSLERTCDACPARNR